MSTHLTRGVFVCALALAASSSCAHGARTATLSSRLVKGNPSASAVALAPQPDMSEWIARMREIQASARPASRAPVLTAERVDPALRQAVTRVAASPTSANHVAAALAYYRARILDAAQDHLAEALRIDRADAAAYDLRARIWRDSGFPQMGVADAHRAVYFAPRSPEARNTLGTVFLAIGQRDEARSAYLKALELDVRAGYAWSNVCHLSALEGDLQGAELACQHALELEPQSVNARKALDRIHTLMTEAGPQSERQP